MFHHQPFPVVAYLAAPTANPQKILQVMQPFQQPLGGCVDPGPDQQEYRGPEHRAAPVGSKLLSKNEMGKPYQFRHPGKCNQQRETDRCDPEDGILFVFNPFHQLFSVLMAWILLAKVMPPTLDFRTHGH